MSAEEDEAADRAFEQRARAELRRGTEQTPPGVQAQLDRIVDGVLRQPPRPRIIRFALPAGAVAIIAGIFVTQQWRSPVAPAAATPASDDFALLLDGDNLDLLEQMEFYQWLDRQPGILDDASVSGAAQRS
jgi:hypothetical protein